MIHLQIAESLDLPFDPVHLETAARKTLLKNLAPEETELTLVIGEDELLQKLNLEYLGIDAPTDVLSFPIGESDPQTGIIYLGDVIISLTRAQVQAEADKHSVLEEMQLLVVHGVLHLLGYDHDGEDSTQRMQSVQDAILEQLGCTIRPRL